MISCLFQNSFQSYCKYHQSFRPSTDVSLGPEEQDVSKKNNSDLDVLAEVDSIQLDDDLIAMTLLDLAQHCPGEDITPFLYTVLKNRNPAIPKSNFRTILNLRDLFGTLWAAICTVYAGILERESPKHESHQWVIDALYILLSPGPHPLPEKTGQIISRWLHNAWPSSIDSLTSLLHFRDSLPGKHETTFAINLVRYLIPQPDDETRPLNLEVDNLRISSWKRITETLAIAVQLSLPGFDC